MTLPPCMPQKSRKSERLFRAGQIMFWFGTVVGGNGIALMVIYLISGQEVGPLLRVGAILSMAGMFISTAGPMLMQYANRLERHERAQERAERVRAWVARMEQNDPWRGGPN